MNEVGVKGEGSGTETAYTQVHRNTGIRTDIATLTQLPMSGLKTIYGSIILSNEDETCGQTGSRYQKRQEGKNEIARIKEQVTGIITIQHDDSKVSKNFHICFESSPEPTENRIDGTAAALLFEVLVIPPHNRCGVSSSSTRTN